MKFKGLGFRVYERSTIKGLIHRTYSILDLFYNCSIQAMGLKNTQSFWFFPGSRFRTHRGFRVEGLGQLRASVSGLGRFRV